LRVKQRRPAGLDSDGGAELERRGGDVGRRRARRRVIENMHSTGIGAWISLEGKYSYRRAKEVGEC